MVQGASSCTSTVACQKLVDRWPGRHEQIRQLVGYLGEPDSPFPTLLIHGGSSTGKTSIVRDVLQELGRPYAYTSCAELAKPRQVLQSVLNQLKGKKRKQADGYCGDSKSEQTADFLNELQCLAPSKGPMLYIVIDHAHRLADQDVLAVLLRLQELAGSKLGVFLISRSAWGSNAFDFDTLRAIRPLQIFFPAYDHSALAKILALDAPMDIEDQGMQIFLAFLRSEIFPVFGRSTNRLEDLQALVGALYPVYLRPVRSGVAGASETTKLHALFKRSLLAAKAAFDSGSGWKGVLASVVASDAAGKAGKTQASELDFELPYHSKFLLLAAYICSRSKPSLDRRIFDADARSGKRHGHMSHDRQVECAREAALKGPQSFPLERMLAMFWHLLRGADDSGEAGASDESQQASDVFMQITSVVSLRLLSRVSGDELEDVKYKCNISDSLASMIAKNLSMKLSDCILYT